MQECRCDAGEDAKNWCELGFPCFLGMFLYPFFIVFFRAIDLQRPSASASCSGRTRASLKYTQETAREQNFCAYVKSLEVQP